MESLKSTIRTTFSPAMPGLQVLHARGLQTLYVDHLHKRTVDHIETPRRRTRVRLEITEVLGGEESVLVVHVTTQPRVESCVGDAAVVHVTHEVQHMRHGRFADGVLCVFFFWVSVVLLESAPPPCGHNTFAHTRQVKARRYGATASRKACLPAWSSKCTPGGK